MNCDWCDAQVGQSEALLVSPHLMRRLVLVGFKRSGGIEDLLDEETKKQAEIEFFSLVVRDTSDSAFCHDCSEAISSFRQKMPTSLYLVAKTSGGDDDIKQLLGGYWPYIMNVRQIVDDVDGQTYSDVLGMHLFTDKALAEAVRRDGADSGKLDGSYEVVAFDPDELIERLGKVTKSDLSQELLVILDATPGVTDVRHVFHARWLEKFGPIDAEVAQQTVDRAEAPAAASDRVPETDNGTEVASNDSPQLVDEFFEELANVNGEKVAELLDRGVDVNSVNVDGEPAIFVLAAQCTEERIFEIVAARTIAGGLMTSVGIQTTTREVLSDIATLAVVFQKAGVDLSVTDSQGRTLRDLDDFAPFLRTLDPG